MMLSKSLLTALLLTLLSLACEDKAKTAPSISDSGKAEDDAGSPRDAGNPPEAGSTPDAAADAGELVLPETLAESGLYAPGSLETLADGVTPFSPRYALWSDGADKKRFVYLPEGAQIDTSDMDFWTYPVGTKAWKEFSQGGQKLETRLLWKTDQGWFMVAFAWNQAGTEAVAAPNGVSNALGTEHDIPARDDCGKCHKGVPDTLLGLSAIQLAHQGSGTTLASLIAEGALSDPPAMEPSIPDTTEWNALGYLHANCGSCHNPNSEAWDRANMDLWLRTNSLADITSTPSYQTSVDVPLTDDSAGMLTLRVASGQPDQSGLLLRMMTRGSDLAMPPLASELTDETGLSLIQTWIAGLAPL